MKLSMWMIANRLLLLQPEIKIQSDAPVTLKSARRFYATDCVYVFSRGKDAVCRNEENYFILKEMDVEQAFEIVQSVFDFYDDWYLTVTEAAAAGDYQKIMDASWHIFTNPMVLLNANNRMLACSRQYDDTFVDAEWEHLMNYGYSSMNAITFIRREPGCCNLYSAAPNVYHVEMEGLSDGLSSPIYHLNLYCGRFNILEKERPLNTGDAQILGILVRLLSFHMGEEINETTDEYCSVFFDLLLGSKVPSEELERQMEYRQWSLSDTFRVWVIRHETEKMDGEVQRLTANLLSRQIPQCEIILLKDCTAILYNENQMDFKKVHEKLETLFICDHLRAGISLPAFSITEIAYAYRQADFALKRGKEEAKFCEFYDFALDYIIMNQDQTELLHACHPDVKKMQQKDDIQSTQRLHTLLVYLNHERSLVNTAQELFVHRNTLVYRIKKMEEESEYNMDNVYTRDYMKTSIRILQLFQY